MNISSIVIHVDPLNVDSIIDVVNQVDFCEYHVHDENGRIIVTIEGDSIEEEIDHLKRIQSMENIIDAQMVFTWSEEELEKAREELDGNEELPEWLNNPDAKMGDIRYGGDLKGRF